MKGTGMLIRTLAAAALGIVSVVPIAAHHSFSAHYLEDQSVSLEGTVKEFQYRSPHAMLVFTAPAPAGRTQTYAAEWANPNRLNRQGITQDTLKPGDVVVVTGSPGRVAADHKVHLKGIRRPADGWEWGRGSRR
ncbi:MAG: hypothetical protein A3F70_14770 [Acidobacteria bacterium RIFCSPLOWO2_12_FULL_67_14]|nr:MAG: hypothetical protein A3F70_14770 [Acidobacteria bacterium RIFCSPLOWO2_12_FULL_67_14]